MKKVVDKRSALLKAALELFAENGFGGSPTALIAKRAGVASGTLFFYFKTKEELICELFHAAREEINTQVMEDLPADLPLRERFLQAFSRILHYFLENPQVFMFLEQYHFSSAREKESCTVGEKEPFRKLLLHAREQKVIKNAPLLVLEAIAFGPIAVMAKEHATHGTPVDEEMINQVVQACWDGVKA